MLRAPPQHIVLVGFMGVGKSTVARLLARRLGWPSVDLDALLARHSGRPIAALFAQVGEREFRRLEAQALRQAMAAPRAQVLATGGGTMLQDAAWDAVAGRGTTVHLASSWASIVARLGRPGARAQRPLWGDQAAVQALLAARLPSYARCAHQIPTDGLTPAGVVSAICRALALEGA